MSQVELEPATHGLREKRLDLSPKEVRYSREIQEWYFAVTNPTFNFNLDGASSASATQTKNVRP